MSRTILINFKTLGKASGKSKRENHVRTLRSSLAGSLYRDGGRSAWNLMPGEIKSLGSIKAAWFSPKRRGLWSPSHCTHMGQDVRWAEPNPPHTKWLLLQILGSFHSYSGDLAWYQLRWRVNESGRIPAPRGCQTSPLHRFGPWICQTH